MEECIICCDKVDKATAVTLNCNCAVFYHDECITEALTHSNKCPHCRKDNIQINLSVTVQIWREDIVNGLLIKERLEYRTGIKYNSITKLVANKLPELLSIGDCPKKLVTLDITQCSLVYIPLCLTIRNLWVCGNSINEIYTREYPPFLEKIDISDNPLNYISTKLPRTVKEFYARNINFEILPKNIQNIDVVII